MTKLKYFALLAVLTMFLAACVPVPAPVAPTEAPAQPIAAAPVTQAEIVNIIWQWVSVTDQTTKATKSVPNPDFYTVIFNADGTLTGKADCNTFAGAYSQENGFTIKLGPSTMAYCGEASLDAAYLQLLSSVAAGGPDGAGNLALETAGGAQRMLFNNGGAPQAAATSEPSAGMIQPQQVSIDTQGLPYSWRANLVPKTPYDASQPPGPKGLPQHIEINFGVTDPADKQPGDPIMYIIPVTAYEQMWDAAGNPSVTNTI
jgi:heat shock protein HslJ